MRRGLAPLEADDGDAARRLAHDLVAERRGLEARVRGVGEPDQDRAGPGGRAGEGESSGENERGAHQCPFRQPPTPSLDSIS